MRVALCAIGRIRKGPERTLIDDYVARFDRTGRALGLGPLSEIEVEPKRASGPEAEAAALAKAIPDGAAICVLDERGAALSSPDLAARLAEWRDEAVGTAAFVIGGADGLTPSLRSAARLQISLGRMVWPHRLVRVMLAEQLYRSASILAGTPYHRD